MAQAVSRNWWHSRPFWALMSLVNLGLAYTFGSWALDTARYWFYILTLVFTWAAIWFAGRAVKNDHK